MADQLYFGNLRHAEWVKAPAPGMGASSVNSSDEMEYSDGGAFVAQSAGSHRVFDKSWPTGQLEDFAWLSSFRDGDWGSGLLYWVDPMAAKLNAFPPHVARPELVAKGWPSLLGAGRNPVLAPSGTTRTNLATNPNSITDVAGYSVGVGTGGAATMTQATSVTPPPAHSGISTAARANWTVAPTAGNYRSQVPVMYGFTAGDPASFRLYARRSTAGTLRIKYDWYAGATYLGQTAGAFSPSLGVYEWTLLEINGAVAPATATELRVYVEPGDLPTVGFNIDILGVFGEKATTAGPYFDGSTEFVDGRHGLWTGAANASTSTLRAVYSNLPNNSSVYTLGTPPNSIPDRKVVLLIPDTETLWFGFTGTASAGGVVRVQPVGRDGVYKPIQDLTLLADDANVRMNTSFDGADYSAVLIYITQTAAGTETVSLTSAKAVYETTGITPVLTGDHVRGYGHSGLRMSGGPTFAYIYYNEDAGKKYVSAAAKFTEVGSWL